MQYSLPVAILNLTNGHQYRGVKFQLSFLGHTEYKLRCTTTNFHFRLGCQRRQSNVDVLKPQRPKIKYEQKYAYGHVKDTKMQNTSSSLTLDFVVVLNKMISVIRREIRFLL